MANDTEPPTNEPPSAPNSGKGALVARGALNAASGAVPLLGGFLAAIAGVWGEREQERVNRFFEHWLKMLAEEMRDKEQTIIEIMSRLDMHNEEISKRVESTEYQSLLRKAFRDWAGADSEEKRQFVRNLLVNAAASTLTSDDVIQLFLKWIKDYSEFHFEVIGAIYNNAGASRGDVWRRLGRRDVREDSPEADLFKLLFRDLSTGGIIRQHRETDYAGNFVAKRRAAPAPKGTPRMMKSAFDDDEQYELTALGQQFVHYAMTDLPPKINFSINEPSDVAQAARA